jgi:hypothetical protein
LGHVKNVPQKIRGLGSNQRFLVQSQALLPLNYPGAIQPTDTLMSLKVRGEGVEPS